MITNSYILGTKQLNLKYKKTWSNKIQVTQHQQQSRDCHHQQKNKIYTDGVKRFKILLDHTITDNINQEHTDGSLESSTLPKKCQLES